MTIQIVPYNSDHTPAVRAFNDRMRAGGVSEAYGIRSFLRESPMALERLEGSGLYEELFLAVDGEDVRGGYSLKHFDAVTYGADCSIAFFQQPISEGTIDRRFVLVGPRLLRDALRRQPLLYALGIGGMDEAAAKLLKGARFGMAPVPFLYRVEHAAQFLREVNLVRTSRSRRVIADAAAATGAGTVGFWLLQHRRAPVPPRTRIVVTRDVPSIGEGADAVWRSNRDAFGFAAVRDAGAVSRLYDHGGLPFLRVAVEEAGKPRGWAVCLATQRVGDRLFGNLKTGSIVDLLAVPGYETDVIGAAVDRLRLERVDLIVTNQSDGTIVAGLRRHGFLDGPSNFLFAASPALEALIGPVPGNLRRFHMNRGDGDGPINL